MDDKGSWDFPWLPTSVSLGLSDMVWSETCTKRGLSFHVVGEVLPHLSSQTKDDLARRVTVPTQLWGRGGPRLTHLARGHKHKRLSELGMMKAGQGPFRAQILSPGWGTHLFVARTSEKGSGHRLVPG